MMKKKKKKIMLKVMMIMKKITINKKMEMKIIMKIVENEFEF